MKFRTRSAPNVLGFQIAPMVDILLVLLCFFIITWNFARKENEISVKVPVAESSEKPHSVVNQTVLNVREDGTVVWNRKEITSADLYTKLKELSDLFPDYAIIVRGHRAAPFQKIADVLDTCRKANIWNVAFATTDKAE